MADHARTPPRQVAKKESAAQKTARKELKKEAKKERRDEKKTKGGDDGVAAPGRRLGPLLGLWLRDAE